MMEHSTPENRWHWDDLALAWVHWAVTAETVADAAHIWGYPEVVTSRWIEGWAIDLEWPHPLHTSSDVEGVWTWLREEVMDGRQIVAEPRQHDYSPAEPGFTVADAEEILLGFTSAPVHHRSPSGPRSSAAETLEPMPGGTGGGPSPEEMLVELAGETSVEDLANRWHLTQQQVIDWAGRLTLEWWGWSIATRADLDLFRARLRTPRTEVGPESGQAVPAAPLPELTDTQRRMLGAVCHLERPTLTTLGAILRLSRHAIADRFHKIGKLLGIEGTSTQIIKALAPRVRADGDLARLVLPWFPLSTAAPAQWRVDVGFTPGQLWVLAAVRHLTRPNRMTIAESLHLPESTVTSRIEALGRILGIEGTVSQIVATLVSWVHPPGDLSRLDLPWPPPDQPVLGQGNRKRRYRHETP